MKSPSTLIVEDDPLTRSWLVSCVLQAFPGARITPVGTVADCRTFISHSTVELALIDLGLPDGTGVDAIEAVRAACADAYMIVVTLSDDDRNLFDALRAGARGYILKDVDGDKVSTLLAGVGKGQPPLSDQMAARMIARFNREGEQLAASPLSPREQEVLRLIAKGYSATACADMLGLTLNTTKSYLKTIYQKLAISSRAEATVEALRLGLIDPG